MTKRRSRSKSKSGVSPVMSMLFGLAVGLSVAAAVYMKDRRDDDRAAGTASAPTEPASLQSAIDENGETAETDKPVAKKEEPRFTFYDLLPNFEVVTQDADEEPAASATAPQAVVEPGVYILQAGSFSTHEDADRRRAELAMQGIASHIQRVKINERNYHRVLIGPIDDLDELNVTRSRLRAAQIDVLRIRVSD
jgi:cell division protein FtsN